MSSMVMPGRHIACRTIRLRLSPLAGRPLSVVETVPSSATRDEKAWRTASRSAAGTYSSHSAAGS